MKTNFLIKISTINDILKCKQTLLNKNEVKNVVICSHTTKTTQWEDPRIQIKQQQILNSAGKIILDFYTRFYTK